MDADNDDPQLVAAALGGDRAALATIYDRYADRVHDMCLHMLRDRDDAADVCAQVFLVAFARLGQLRDPQRLRSWLFAIARHEVYRRSRERSRTRLVEGVDQMDDLTTARAASADDGTGDEVVDAAAMVAVLREAAAGLDDRDRLVMELQLQGLDGDELASALGTSVSTGYQHVHRMRERLGRSVGALLVARQGREECGGLDRLLADWDGTFSVLWRKRVARHVDGCEVCERRRRAIPATLFGGTAAALPMVPVSALSAAPASIRDRVLGGAAVGSVDGGRGWRDDGFPGPDASRRSLVAALGLVVLLVIVAALAFVLLGGRDDEELAAIDDTSSTTTTGAPATTTTSTSTTTSIAAAPAPAPTTTVAPPGAPSGQVPAAPAPSTTVAPAPPPPALPEPTPPTSPEPGPEVDLTFVPRVLYHPSPGFSTCGATVEVVAFTPAGAAGVQLWWRDASGADGLVEMQSAAGEWRAVVELPKELSGPATLLAVARDDAGRTGVSDTIQVPVRDCPTPG